MAVYTDNGTNTPNGSHLEFTYTFPTIKTDGTDVKVALNGQTQATNKYTVTTTSPTKITFNNTSPDSTLQESTGAPKTGVTVRVYRDTYVDAAEAVYAAGSSIRAADLNNNQDQVLFALQEEQQLTINSEDITAGAVNSTHILDGTIVEADIANDAVTTDKIATDAITNAKLANSVVNTDELANGAVSTAKLANDAVTTLKIDNDAVTGAKIASSTITNDNIALNTITGNRIADDAISSGELAANSVGTSELKDNAVETANIADDAITNALIATGAVTSDSIGTGAVTGNGLQASAVSTAKIADNAVQTAKINGLAVTTAKIDNDAVDGTKIADNAIGTEHIADAELTTLAGMQSGTASVLAGSTALTSTLTELNMLDGKSIVTSISSPTDVQIPTAQAVEERIVDLVTDVGGFRPIANETSFPTTNPDPEDNAGTIVSIKALNSNLTSNGSGVATITDGAGSGNDVTINGMANSDTIEAGKGILVETTSTLHTYTFHRETLAPADITTAQTAVNDFNARYRILPSGTNINTVGSLDDGDLLWDSNADKMKVYDATASAWKEVTSTGDFKLLFLCPFNGTGAPTIDGSIAKYDLREGSNSGSAASVTSAAQLLVSVNGVVQKANTGTSAPSEGFALVDSNTIIFGANLASGDSVFIHQSGSAISIPTPGDDTVSTVKIQNLAVDNSKIADDTIKEAKLDVSNNPTNGQFLQAQSGEGGGLTWATVTTSPTTTRGDIIYRGASADERLAGGNAGKYLRMGSNDPEWADVGEANHIGLNDDTNLHFGTGGDALIRYYESGTGAWTGGVAGAQFTIQTLTSSDTDTTPIRFFTSAVVSGNRIYTQYAAMSPTNKDVALFYNGNQKFITTNTGVTVTGTVAATAFTGDGSALTGISGGVTSDGAGNTHAGTDAGNSDNYSSALNNSCFGKNSGTAITEGDHNTLIGKDAGDAINTGSGNTAVGTTALTTLSTGGTNTAIGKDALGLATTGSSNTAVGASALYATTTADENTAVGLNALQDNITGHSNVAIGSQTLREATAANYNTAVGKQAMQNATGGENTAIGSVCMIDTTTGTQNVAIGRECMLDNTTGIGNTAVGKSALSNNTTGGSNVAIGRNALLTSTYRHSQVAIGQNALRLCTDGYSNTAVGMDALDACTTGYQNVAFGEHAGRYITSGDYNVCVGRYGGSGITEGNNNIAIGPYALMATVTGNNNVCMGYEAGTAITSGAQNTCLGKEAGKSLTTGSHSICVGYRAGKDQMTTTGDQLYIANGSFSAGNDNCFIYGNSLGELIQGSNSSSWYTTSDSRLKKNIVDNNVGLSIIDNIKVRNFEYKTEAEIDRSEFPKVSTDKYTKEEADEGEGTEGDYKQGLALIHPGTQLGVIAQELESIAPNCVKTDHREVKTVSTDDLFWHMINAIKELSTKNTALEARIATLEAA